MEIQFANDLFRSRIIVLLEINNSKNSYDLASCLVDSGIENLEIALRTPSSRTSAEIIRKHFNSVNVGLGTVTSLEDVNFAADIESKFCFAPNCNPKILKACNSKNLFFIPGISSIKEVELACQYDYNLLKFYPAEESGGISKLTHIFNNLQEKKVKFIPSGGINLTNMNDYLDLNFVIAVAGSWIAPKSLIDAKNWKEIASRAKQSLISLRG